MTFCGVYEIHYEIQLEITFTGNGSERKLSSLGWYFVAYCFLFGFLFFIMGKFQSSFCEFISLSHAVTFSVYFLVEILSRIRNQQK